MYAHLVSFCRFPAPWSAKTFARCCGIIWTDKMLLVIGFIYSKYFLYKDECSSGKCMNFSIQSTALMQPWFICS